MLADNRFIRYAVLFNFAFAVALSLLAGLLAAFDPQWLAPELLDWEGGPLINNVVIALGLLAVLQLLLLGLRYWRGGYNEAAIMGMLFLLMAIDLAIYSETNQLGLDSVLIWGSGYIGVSHIVYFLICAPETPPTQQS